MTPTVIRETGSTNSMRDIKMSMTPVGFQAVKKSIFYGRLSKSHSKPGISCAKGYVLRNSFVTFVKRCLVVCLIFPKFD